MDELAVALAIDPLELRLRNHADHDPHSGLPWSSKSLRECYAVGAERFGWRARCPEPRSMRHGHWLIGWGMASATCPVHRQRAAARAGLLADGTAVVQPATHDLGPGTYTVMSQVAAEMLGLPVDQVRFEMGDSDLPDSPRAAGSMTAASVAPAVAAAARALRDQIIAAACADDRSPLGGLDPGGVEIRDGTITSRRDPARAERCADAAARRPAGLIEALGEADAGAAAAAVSTHAFGASFAEVAVDADLGEVRVRRFVACYGAGRILNAKMARSQQIGGIVFGDGMALGEATRLDAASGRITNARLTDHLLPVHADVPDIGVSFVAEEDPHVNATGVTGIGMIVAVGVAAANAVFHATGVRVRNLPITPDKLL